MFKATKTGISEDRVKYTIQTAPIKAGLTVEICGALNGTSLCVQNQSVALDSRGANFTLSLGNKVLYTGTEFEGKMPLYSIYIFNICQNKIECKFVNFFLLISFIICFGCSNEPSH